MNTTTALAFVVVMGAGALSAAHTLTLDGPVTHPEEGLILGNGDLSCSVYNEADEIVFRFGKGDVWDRRLDFSHTARPVTHDEFVRGLLDEGWTCANYSGDQTKATKGTKDEKRMKEVCTGSSKTTKDWPYPCPKPTGELHMRLPPDLPRPVKLRQSLPVEEGVLQITVEWRNGVCLTAEAAIAPGTNVFSLKWRIDGWDPKSNPSKGRPPVSFILMRRADEPALRFAERYSLRYGLDWLASRWRHDGITPLPAPIARKLPDGRHAIEQEFPADPTFPKGFRCRLTLQTDSARACIFSKGGRDSATGISDAHLACRPPPEHTTGELQVAVTTSRDATLDAPAFRPHAEVAAAARAAAAKSWALSGVKMPDDPFLEWLWYATYHVRRCVLRGGTVPPGLYLPSTVNDYSLWHGDYHSNYNYQSIYWGGFTANRLDEMTACMDCTDFFLDVGRLRAQRYYGMRGSFIPLEGFPVKAADDYSSAIPLGRMVYMTGWAAVPFWEYYLHTLDRDFLARRGYPAIRDCALFLLDFLKKAPSKDLPPHLNDGLYHAFPSIEEEYPIKGLADVTDRPQVIAFTRYALYVAIQAAAVLNVDADLRAAWQDRLDNLAGTMRNATGYAKHCYLANSPEFGYRTPPPRPAAEWKAAPKKAAPGWYFGHSVRSRVTELRTNRFIPGRDFDEYRAALEYWAHPNGLVWGMSLGVYGRAGGWTETLSCMAPLQEMMLQSWDGAIRIFPYWPKDRRAAFRTFRAQGAFLVSAEWKDGRVSAAEIRSEKGAPCLLHGDWTVTDATGAAVPTDHDAFGRLRFQTIPGGVYALTAKCQMK